MSNGDVFAPCKVCVFYSNYRTGGLFHGCNLDNKVFEQRESTDLGDKLSPCYDHRNIYEIMQMLEFDDDIVRTIDNDGEL